LKRHHLALMVVGRGAGSRVPAFGAFMTECTQSP
jgi:hypothetical protein